MQKIQTSLAMSNAPFVVHQEKNPSIKTIKPARAMLAFSGSAAGCFCAGVLYNEFMAVLFFLLYGIIALVSQLLLLQELVIVFSGHELFLGFSLAAWMGWVGAGSWIARRPKWNRLALILAGLIPFILFNLILIRLSKLLFGFGMLIGLLPMLALTILLLAPIGIAIGLIFTLGCAWSHDRYQFPLGWAYFYETLGAALGGILYSWLAAGRLPPEWTLFFISVATAVLLTLVVPARKKRLTPILVILTIF